MVYHGHQGKPAGTIQVRKSGSVCPKSVDGSVCHGLLVESGEMRPSYIMYRTDDMNYGGSGAERLQCFWMQMIIHRNCILAVDNEYLNCMQKNYTLNNCSYVSELSLSRG